MDYKRIRLQLLLSLLAMLILVESTSATSNNIANITIQIIGLPAGLSGSFQIASYNTYHWQLGDTNTSNYYSSANTIPFTTTAGVTTVIISNMIRNATTSPIQITGFSATQAKNGNQYLACTSNYNTQCSGYTNPTKVVVNPNSPMSWAGTTAVKYWTSLNITQWNAQQANELIAMGVPANSPIIIGLIGNVLNSTTYGNAQQSGNYVAAGKSKSYSTYDSSSGSLNFVTTNVLTTPVPACVTTPLSSASYCSNATTPIPIKFIITPQMQKQGFYWANFTLTGGRMLANNKANFNFTVQDLSNSAVLTPLTTISSTNSMTVQLNFKVPLTHQIDVSFSAKPITAGGGANNYSTVIDDPVTVPTNVLYYVPFNVISSNAISANTQLSLTLDAGKYTQYEAGNFMNLAGVFNTISGALLNTWNENGNSNTANAVIIWVKIPEAYTTDNNLAMGFYAISTNNYNSLGTWGEAPQLSSTDGLNDNGNTVFNNYQNWGNTILLGVLPTGWTNDGTPTTTFNPTNIIIKSSNTGAWHYIREASPYSNSVTPFVMDWYGAVPNNAIAIGIGTAVYNQGIMVNKDSTGLFATTAGSTGDGLAMGSYPVGLNMFNNYYISTSSFKASMNYGSLFTPTGAQDSYTYFSIYIISQGGNAQLNLYYTRFRTYPTNGVMPSVTYGALTAASSTTTLTATPNPYTLSNTSIDINQISVANTVISNGQAGTTSYTANWVWSAPNTVTLSNTIVFALDSASNVLSFVINAVGSNAIKITANTLNPTVYWANAVGTNTIYGTWTFNAYAGDALGDTSPSPVLTNTITISPQLAAGTLTETNTLIDNSQYSILGSSTTGGTQSITINWFNAASCGGTYQGSGSTIAVNPSSNTVYSFNAVDSATTKNVMCSSSNTLTVRATPTLTLLTPSNTNLDSGQSVTYNVLLTSGADGSAFTVNLINGGLVSSLASQSAGTLTFASNIPTLGSHTYYVAANDLTPTTPFGFSSATSTITVNAVQSAGILTESNTVIDNSQYSILTGNPSGGTPPYTISYFNAAGCGGTLLGSGTTLAVNPSSTTTYSYNSVDSATTKNVVCSSSNSITVYTTPISTLSFTNTGGNSISYGTTAIANDIVSSGSGSFTWAWTINNVYAYNVAVSTTQTSNTYVLPAIGNYVYNVIVTDTGTTTHYVLPLTQNTLVIDAALAAGTLTETNTIIDNSQYSILGSNPTGGTPSYTINWFTNGACTAPAFTSGTTATVNPSSTTTYTYNVVDSATPKNVMCSPSNTLTVRATPTVTLLLVSNTLLDLGQSFTSNIYLTSASGGSSFTVNLVDGGLVSSLSGRSAGTLTFASNTPTAGSHIYYVAANDLTPTTPFGFSSATNTITVNSALVAGILTETNTVIDNSQYSILAANPSGGTPTYGYNWFASTVGNPYCNNANVVSGASQTKAVNPSATTYYSYNVIDSATTKNVMCSSSNTLTVRATPTLTLLTPSNTLLDYGQYVTYNVFLTSASGGSSFTVNLINGGLTNSLSGRSAGTLTFASNQPAQGIQTFYVAANDLTPTTPYGFGSASNIITVYAAPTVSISPTSWAMDSGQSKSFTATANHGSSSFSYAWYYKIGAGSYTAICPSATTTCTFNGNATTIGSDTVNVIITDTGTTTPATASAISSVTVNGILLANAITPTSPTIISGNSVNLNSNPSQGTPPYSYQWYTGVACTSPIGSATSANYLASPSTTTTYYYQVTDTASATACSAGDTVTVIQGLYLRNATANPAIIFPTLAGVPVCANTLSGTCQGNDILAGTLTLNNNLFVFGNVSIPSGSTLNSNGFSIIASMTFNGLGATIITPNLMNGGNAPVTGVGSSGGNYSISYAGSGGGGGGSTDHGGNGGNTLIAGGTGGSGADGGAGSTPSAPTLTNANIIYWFTNGFQNYLSSAGGGGAGSYGYGSGQGGAGGAGSTGIYIQATTIVAPTIYANGIAGGAGNAGGGGGGGGVIILAYGTSYAAGTYHVSGGAGGSCGSCFNGHAGGAGGAGQALTYHYSTAPIPVSVSQYFPVLFYTSSSDNTITFTLNSIFNGITITVQSGVLNINYVPPANSPSGIYTFNVAEMQGAGTTYTLANILLNMSSLANTYPKFNLTGENFSDEPLALYIPNSMWNSPPSSWVLDGYAANVNGNVVNSASSTTNSLPLNVQAIYAFTSFNLTNNTGLSKNSLALYPFLTIATSNVPNTLYNRAIVTTNSYSETYTTLNSTMLYSATASINNHAVPLYISMALNNSNTIYIANSAYQNPLVLLLNQTSISTAAFYNTRANNWWDTSVLSNSVESLNTYLPSLANASQYQFLVYGCTDYAVNDRISSNRGTTGSQTQVQLYKMTSIPFSMPLQNGYPYGFTIYTSSQHVVLVSSTGAWTYPTVSLYINCTSNVPTLTIPNISISCNGISNPSGNLITTCSGKDTRFVVSSWSIQFYNKSTLISTMVFNTVNVTGANFVATYTFPTNTLQYFAHVAAYLGNVNPPNWGWNFAINSVTGTPLNPDFVFIGLVMILLPVVLGYFNRTGLLLLEMFTIVAGQTLGLLAFTTIDVAGFVILSGLVIVIDEIRP